MKTKINLKIFAILMSILMVLSGSALAIPMPIVSDTSPDTPIFADIMARDGTLDFETSQALDRSDRFADIMANDGTSKIFIKMVGADSDARSKLSTNTMISMLQTHASDTQEPIIKFLNDHGAEVHNTFWIDNLILTTVDNNLIPVLFYEFPEIENIFPNFEVTILPHTEQYGNESGENETILLVNETILPVNEPASVSPTWGVNRVRAPEVWEEGINGTGVRIAVLDTGVHIDHPDLVGSMWTDDPTNPEYPGGWIEFDGHGHIVVNSVPHDTGWHGTHCSGTALGGATGDYAIGVAPGAYLMHALILPGGSGTFAQVAAGMQWTIAPTDDAGDPAGEPADVVSMSLGAPGFHDAMIEPIENLIDAGIVPVVSIGNLGEDTSGSPGNVFESFSIGATAEDDTVPWWSSGQIVDWPASYPYPYIVPDFAAPGVDVLSAMPPNEWGYASGTSMAAPHVAGIVALMLQYNPDLTVDDIYEMLRNTACDLGDPDQDTRFGWGIVDAFDATMLNSGIEGVVTDATTGVPLAGAAVYVHDVGTVYTNDIGQYTAWLSPGEYTLTASIFGYGETTATVTVVEAEFAVQNFTLTPLPTGYIAGIVTSNETNETIAGAVVTVLETPLTTETNAEGFYTLEVPIGTWDIQIAMDGYMPITVYGVLVEEDVTTMVDVALEPGLDVAVIGDWGGQLEELLDAHGHMAEQRGWDIIPYMDNYDVVVVNRRCDPGEAIFLEFLAEAEEHGVGVVFTSSFPVTACWGITLLQDHLGDPMTQGVDFYDGPVFYNVTRPHPIFDGWEVGEQIIITDGGDNDNSWFMDYSGVTAADVGSYGEGVRGGGMAFTIFDNNAHLLLASLGPQIWTNVPDWTDDGIKIFVRGVEWVADPPLLQSITLCPMWGPPGANVTVSGREFPPNTAGVVFAIEPDAELLKFADGVENLDLLSTSVINPIPFVTDENGKLPENLTVTILDNAPLENVIFVVNVGSFEASAPFLVTLPQINLTPNYGPPGTRVTITGRYFFGPPPDGTVLGMIDTYQDGIVDPTGFLAVGPYGEFEVKATILDGTPLCEPTFQATVDNEVLATAVFDITEAPLVPPFVFSLEVDPTEDTIRQGDYVNGIVTATHLNGTAEEVTLNYSLPNEVEGVSVFFEPESGTPYQDGAFVFNMTISVAPWATVGVHNITINGTAAGGLVRTTTFTLTVLPIPFDFSLSVNPDFDEIMVDGEVTTTVNTRLDAGITEEVTLTYSVEPFAEDWITVNFEPDAGTPSYPVNGNFTSNMTVIVDPYAPPGEDVDITITATSAEGLIKDTIFTLSLSEFNFNLMVHPDGVTIPQDDSAMAMITVTHLAGHYEEFVLEADLPEGVEGITVVLTPPSGYPNPIEEDPEYPYPVFTSMMTITANEFATVGEIPITITANSSLNGWERTTTFDLIVTPALPFDFNLAVTPTEDTIEQGENTTADVIATHVSGPGENVTLTYSLPAGVEGINVFFDPEVDEPDFESTMTIATSRIATVGEHEITIIGTSANHSETATFILTVEATLFEFDLTVDPAEVTITQPGNVTATINATHTAGITEEVIFTYELHEDVEGISISFEPIADEPSFESIMTVTVATNVTPGEHKIIITGTSDTAIDTVIFTLTVDFDSYAIDLEPGWNLISMPLIPSEDRLNIEVALADIMGDVRRVWHYDAESHEWYVYPHIEGINPLNKIEDGKGYWVYMSNATTLYMTGTKMPPAGGSPLDYPLYAGWNHIGFTSTSTTTNVSTYLGDIVMDTFVRMWGFNAITGEWCGPMTGDDLLIPGRGYWLAVSENGTIFPAGVSE